MPVAFRAGTAATSGTAGGSTITFSYTSGSGADRLMLVNTRGSVDASAVSYGGGSLTNVGAYGNIRLWRRVAPATGTNNLVITLSSYQYTTYSVSDWTGVDQTTPIGSVTSGTGTNNSASTGSITCPTDGAVYGVVSSGYAVAPGTITATAGTLIAQNRSYGNGFTQAHSYRTTTGALSWNLPAFVAYGYHGFPINPVVTFTAKLPELHLQAVQRSVI